MGDRALQRGQPARSLIPGSPPCRLLGELQGSLSLSQVHYRRSEPSERFRTGVLLRSLVLPILGLPTLRHQEPQLLSRLARSQPGGGKLKHFIPRAFVPLGWRSWGRSSVLLLAAGHSLVLLLVYFQACR